MRKILLFSVLALGFGAFSQVDSRAQVKSELMQWDAVRGEWLAESFEAMANNQPIPDRTFPEDLTPDEMYRLVPQDRQSRIQQIVNQSSNETVRQLGSTQNQGESNRRPVGSTTNTSSNRTPSVDRYPTYFQNSNCNLVTGRTYGDPHIRTFDGKTYSFQTVGEYVLSSSPDRSFEVQARQKPETNSVSLNTAVAMNVYGDRVGIYASDSPDPVAGTPVRVNGRSVYLNNETFYLPHGGTIENNGREYIVTWPTGEKVQAKLSTSSGMRFMNISVFVKECRGDYRGLLGNANGRSDDDFAGGNGRVNLATSTIFDPFDSRDFGRSSSAMEREHLAFLARDFGNQFLVNDQTSLFEYGFGQSSWSFYDPSFPRNHLTMADIAQADRERARRECMQQGILADDMYGCVMDLAHANIPPTPRPSVPNRVGNGRTVNPVTERRPNVNRPDVFERVPSGGGRVSDGGSRATSDGGRDSRTPVSNNGNVNESIERTPSNPPVRKPVEEAGSSARPTVVIEGENVRTPDSGIETGKAPVKGDVNTTIERTPSNPPVRKPVGESNSGVRPATTSETKVPSSGNAKPEQRPEVVRKPVPSSNPVLENAPSSAQPARKPADRNVNTSVKPTAKDAGGTVNRSAGSIGNGRTAAPVNTSPTKSSSSSPRGTTPSTNSKSGR